MANSKLLGQKFHLPHGILDFLKKKTGEGAKRVSGLLADGFCTYEQMKRIKHDIENKHYTGDWRIMLGWIDRTLAREREKIKRSKTIKSDMGHENSFIKTHEKDALKIDTDTLKNILFKEEINKIIDIEIKNYLKENKS